MSARKDGGPAFPRDGHPDKNDFPQSGMTLRDYFAGQALAGWLASFGPDHEVPAGPSTRIVACQMYDLADAMIAAREES